MDINHISVSRKKTFDTCTQQYKYRYHLKLDPSGPEPYYFSYGKIIHKIAEEYVSRKGETTIGEIGRQVLRGKILLEANRAAPPLEKDYEKKFQKHLRAIENLTKKIGYTGLLEYEFRFDLDPPNKREVTGFLDRLIIRDDKAFILDYKTTKKGKWRVNKETVKTDLQLRTYARVVHKEFGIEPKNIKVALYYLEGEDLIAATYSEASLLETEDSLRKAYFKIEKFDPDKAWGKTGWHCNNCVYNDICPFFTPKDKKGEFWDGDMSKLGY